MSSSPALALHSTRGRVALVATVAASAMASLDATVVNVALPHIGRDFHASVSALQWVLTGYLLTLASLILLGGALGDRLGRRKVFVIGTAWFALASLACGAAPNIEVLVAARVLQGIGGALLTPGSLAIIQASFREHDRAPAVGAWSGLGAAAGAIGPLLGGALVSGPGWRWAFLINLPVAVIAIVCARVAVPETLDPHAGHIDVTGALLAACGLATSTWAFIEAGPHGWVSPSVLAALVIAIVSFGALVQRVRTRTDALVPRALFENRTFSVVNLMTVLLYAAIGVTFFLVVYQFEVVSGWSALAAGVSMLPATVLMLVLSAPSGALAARIGPRLQLTLGPLIAACGLLLLTRVGTHASYWRDLLPGAIVFGLGLVTFVAPLTATVMAAADADHVSIASGVNNAMARAANLAALAFIPVVSGLSTATGPDAVTHAYRIAMLIAAALAASASVVAAVGLRRHVGVRRSARRVLCAVDGTPLQPDPRRCPELVTS